MKKTLLIVITSFISILITVTIFIKNKTNFKNSYLKYNQETIEKQSNLPTNIIINTPTFSPNKTGYKSNWIIVNEPSKIFLYSNLKEKRNSYELATLNNCAHLISGGFYDKNGKHIGLFVSQGELLSPYEENQLFNGYFSIDYENKIEITEYPIFKPRISLQSGPILIRKGNKITIKLKNDENSRRIVLGLTKKNKVLFMAIYDESNNFSGPKLEELPNLIEKINIENDLELMDVINLDGGSHSAFISDYISISELSIIGSYFCIKP